ncbi:MAG: 50S ribosomal protein L6, partial [Thermodesulfobacteriota bacterium]
MSRIGRMPIAVPKEVKVASDPPKVDVTGPKGLLTYQLPQGISVSEDGGKILVHRANDQRTSRALQGLARSLIANMVTGVTRGFEKKLEIIGVGFRADLQGQVLKLTLGYSHPVLY